MGQTISARILSWRPWQNKGTSWNWRQSSTKKRGAPLRKNKPCWWIWGGPGNRIDDAALLAASRGGEPRAAEMARELLPDRYPYVSEFRRALELDAANLELRRELAYLLLRMDHQGEAE